MFSGGIKRDQWYEIGQMSRVTAKYCIILQIF